MLFYSFELFQKGSEQYVLDGGTERYAILKQFPFSSEERVSASICRCIKTNKTYLSIKGAPEVIIVLCNNDEFNIKMAKLSNECNKKGYRVIGLGVKELNATTIDRFRTLKDCLRERFALTGLAVFKNELKNATVSVIKELQSANIPCLMATGDSLKAAVYTGIASKMITELPDFEVDAQEEVLLF